MWDRGAALRIPSILWQDIREAGGAQGSQELRIWGRCRGRRLGPALQGGQQHRTAPGAALGRGGSLRRGNPGPASQPMGGGGSGCVTRGGRGVGGDPPLCHVGEGGGEKGGVKIGAGGGGK